VVEQTAVRDLQASSATMASSTRDIHCAMRLHRNGQQHRRKRHCIQTHACARTDRNYRTRPCNCRQETHIRAGTCSICRIKSKLS
jgi:hypothetical protein